MSREGASLSKIAQALQEQGIRSPGGKTIWSRETLRKILNNEKYFGTVILQKTVVANCLNHKQTKNTGQQDQYKITNNHNTIIIERPQFAMGENWNESGYCIYLAQMGFSCTYSIFYFKQWIWSWSVHHRERGVLWSVYTVSISKDIVKGE